MKMNKFLFLALFLLVALTSFSQTLLWKISGKDLQSPSYLYGTNHIQDQRVFNFDNTVLDALSSCQAFAGELLLDQIDAAAVRESIVMPKGKTIREMMSKEDYALLDSICKARIGASVLFMNTIKPIYLSTTLEMVQMAKDKEDALDLFLLKQARKQQKSCYGLETYQGQMNAIDAIPVEEQMIMLDQVIHPDSTSANNMDTMLLTYLNMDLEKMFSLTADPSLPKKFNKVLVLNRNVTMAKGFVKIAKKETLFCAVGAGHLGGDKGVLALLRKKGYTVEPIYFNWVTKE